jgi:hypothetical protein
MTRSPLAHRTTSLLAGAALTLGLVAVPAAAAHAGYTQQFTLATQAQCLFEQKHWKRDGYRIVYSCYATAGMWVFYVYFP